MSEEKPPACAVCGRDMIKHVITNEGGINFRWVCAIHGTRGAK